MTARAQLEQGARNQFIAHRRWAGATRLGSATRRRPSRNVLRSPYRRIRRLLPQHRPRTRRFNSRQCVARSRTAVGVGPRVDAVQIIAVLRQRHRRSRILEVPLALVTRSVHVTDNPTTISSSVHNLGVETITYLWAGHPILAMQDERRPSEDSQFCRFRGVHQRGVWSRAR